MEVGSSFITMTVQEESQVTPQGWVNLPFLSVKWASLFLHSKLTLPCYVLGNGFDIWKFVVHYEYECHLECAWDNHWRILRTNNCREDSNMKVCVIHTVSSLVCSMQNGQVAAEKCSTLRNSNPYVAQWHFLWTLPVSYRFMPLCQCVEGNSIWISES